MNLAQIRTAALLCLVLVLATGLAARVPAAAADAAPSLIIFDGSGSMWGKIEGDKRSKLDIARDAVKSSLAKVPATASYGLMSFGHRRSGDCSDIQLLAPVASGDAAKIGTLLDKLNPRGKGPIAGAIREAGKALAGTAGNVVLIHDNADNCRQDACEAANEVHAASPKLRFHLVSIALEPDEASKMACVAKTTGGTTFDAPDAARLQQAVGDAIRMAMIDPSGGQAGGGGPAATPQKAAAPKDGPAPLPAVPGLYLSAKLSRDSGPLDGPVRWIVRKGDAIVFEGSGATVFARLDPGSYAVEARVGLATGKAKADVAAPTATPLQVPLDAAALRIAVKDLKDGPVSASAHVTLYKADETTGKRPIWIGRAAEAELVLPAGSYRIAVADGLVTREETMTLAAGASSTRDIVTGAGRLEVTPVARPDGPPLEGVTILLARDDPEAADGRREIARSAALKPSFVLAAGTYYITARSGAGSVRERVAVGAGDTVKRTITLALARLTIAPTGSFAKAAAGGAPRPGLKTRVLTLDATPREVARSMSATPEFQLAPGRYRIEAIAGAHNARVSQIVDLEPQANRTLSLRLDAQTVVLRLAGGGGQDIAWEVRDAGGALVTRTLDPAPSLVLVPGRYQVRAETRDKAAAGSFEVAAGGEPQVQTVELSIR